MRAFRLALALACLGGVARGQDLVELSEQDAMPGSIATALQAELSADEVLDRVRRWQGDLVGDATADQIVQAAIATGGGNAYYLRHWIFQADARGFVPVQEIVLPDGIISARREGSDLVLTLYLSLPEDPRCCPSGQQEVRLPLP